MKEYLPTYSRCFVCGKHNLSGLKRRFYVQRGADQFSDNDKIAVRITFSKEHVGFKGVVHGGIITAIIDEAMGWAASINTGRIYVTADLNVRFVKPVMINEELTFIAWMNEDKKRVSLNEGVVINSIGEVLVKSSGKFFAMNEEETKKVVGYLTFEEGTLDIFK